nr:hypothetical protein CFP56_31445 [Quercus suber]
MFSFQRRIVGYVCRIKNWLKRLFNQKELASAVVVELNTLAGEVSKPSNISVSSLLVFKGCYAESTNGGSS